MQKSLLSPFIIYLIIPLIGLSIFIWLLKKMKNEEVVEKPTLSLFLLFFNYGGLLMVILTNYFWQWSGLASLGVFYLMFFAPVIMMVIGFIQYRLKAISGYHLWIFRLAALYIISFPLTLAIIFYTT